MTKDEALKLALEALEEAADAIDSWGSYASGYFQVKHDLESDISKAKSAITAIKEALAQPEQEPVAWLTEERYAQLHTAQRTWVGLTDEEVHDIVWSLPYEPSQENIRAIEAKLKEKNK